VGYRQFARDWRGRRTGVLPGMKQRRAGSIVTISSSRDIGLILDRRCRTQQPTHRAKHGTHSKDQQRALIDMHPIKRLGTPEDVAGAALFLASDASG